jgi:hypothetical protein
MFPNKTVNEDLEILKNDHKDKTKKLVSGFRRQRTDDGGQMTEDGGWMTEGRRQMMEHGRQMTEDR